MQVLHSWPSVVPAQRPPLHPAPLFHHRGIVTVLAPREDVAPSAQQPPVAPEHEELITRINKMLQSRARFRMRMEVIWRRAVGRKPVPFADLPEVLNRVASKLQVPQEVFDDLDTVFMYDFTGEGALTFKEAYTLVKDRLASYRKALGGHPVVDVPFTTLEAAGYRVVKVLASGGQGTAKLATDAQGQRKVLKVYPKGIANAVSLQDLREEMENMSRAQHPNIAVCHEVFQDSWHLYMVGEPYMGGDLVTLQHRALRDGVDLTEDWYESIFHQAFTGLDYLHRSCVVHCDIKEPNIMVKSDKSYAFPDVVIIDLGLASTFKPKRGACGTPGYMPPETWDYGVWFPRGDVFSMGVVCFQMLSGRVPGSPHAKPGLFQRARDVKEVARLTKSLLPAYEEMEPNSELLMSWLPRCLHKDYRQRPKPAEVLEYPWFAQEREKPWQKVLPFFCCE